MIKLVLQDNPQYIKALLWKDGLYKTLLRDINFHTWLPSTDKINWYAAVKDRSVVGMFITHEQEDNTVFHGGVYKQFRGNTVNLLKECLNALPSNYQTNFITTVHQDNRLAQKIHKKSGFVLINKINDILIYGEQ